MIDIGHFALVAAWLLTVYGVIGGAWGAFKNNRSLISSAANGLILCAGFSLISLLALAVAFVTHDYRYTYVWQHSNNTMHPMYLVSAIWGGMDGSMLLWAAVMAVFSGLVVIRSKGVHRDLMKWAVPVLSGATGFFLFVTTFLTNPFRLMPATHLMSDGRGLNPLLQNPLMMIHPPVLYLGFTGFVVPFAFCLAALLSGRLQDDWIRVTRRWTLISWVFLTVGIVLGGKWAYVELGWGGFWAWDPVENASFLPWLTGTAFLHSVMVQEQRGMLKVWNVILSVATYLLTVFGTFLTRSGVVQSVHAFASTDVGWVFLAYIGAMSALTIGLVIFRREQLRPENALESYVSREAAFLFNNIFLLGICFATFWGVMFPVFSEWATGEKMVVGPPFFNRVNVPLFLGLLLLMGVGPLVAWRRSSARAVFRTFYKSFLVGSAVTIIFLIVDPSRVLAAVSFGLSVFVIASIEAEFRRAAKNRKQFAKENAAMRYVQVVKRKPRRYGGFLVHLGVAIMAIAITGAMAYKIERDITLRPGERAEVGRYGLVLEQIKEDRRSNHTAMIGLVRVENRETGNVLGYLRPERRAYHAGDDVTTEVALRITPREDLYVAMAGIDTVAQPGTAPGHGMDMSQVPVLFKVFVNPLQVWLWFGGLVVVFGSLIVLFQGLLLPATYESRAVQAAGARVTA